MSDFWFFAGIALVILATGYGCDQRLEVDRVARARFIDACTDRMIGGAIVPPACGVNP